MGKNTFLAPLPQKGTSSDTPVSGVKKQDEPSPITIKNILNYSKSLRLHKRTKGNDFIEYIAN